MRKLIITSASAAALVLLAPTAALAQLQFDPTSAPPRETGGWVFNAAQLMAFLGVVLIILIWAGYMRWSPKWAARRQAKQAPPPGSKAPELAPQVPKPEPQPTAPLPPEAAAASAVSIGESLPAAVAVKDVPKDVYHDTLEELLAKGVPQKVAEARARAAANKAQG